MLKFGAGKIACLDVLNEHFKSFKTLCIEGQKSAAILIPLSVYR